MLGGPQSRSGRGGEEKNSQRARKYYITDSTKVKSSENLEKRIYAKKNTLQKTVIYLCLNDGVNSKLKQKTERERDSLKSTARHYKPLKNPHPSNRPIYKYSTGRK
jgi:hypothetical protein